MWASTRGVTPCERLDIHVAREESLFLSFPDRGEGREKSPTCIREKRLRLSADRPALRQTTWDHPLTAFSEARRAPQSHL